MLHEIGDGVWAQEGDIRLPGGMWLPSRATILRRPDGGLVLHSPLAIDEATGERIDALGEVKTIIAPSCIHFFFLKAAMERYPKARVLGAPGLEKKVPGVPFEPLPASGAIEALGEGFRLRRIEGVPYVTEHVFLHEASRTLVVTDLVFNVHRCRGLRMKAFFWLVGAWKKTAQSRMWRLLTKDRRAAATSTREVLDWDWERVVPAHGDVVSDDARARLRSALAWITRGAAPLLGAGTVAAR